MNCLFCRILKKEIPSTKIYEDNSVYAFRDINPMAPIHFLFIHKNHSANVTEMTDLEVSQVFSAINKVVKEQLLDKSGFRIVSNTGAHGGQTVFHTHFHLLAGDQLGSFA